MKIGDIVQCDSVADAPYRTVLGVKTEDGQQYILINFGNWSGWVPVDAYKHILCNSESK